MSRVPFYADDTITLHHGTALDVLPDIPDQSVDCVVTSPPYFGLRSYLPADHPDKAHEIGTEPTPAEFVANLVAVFREVRRVLADDGTMWVNLGDSYAGRANAGAAYTKNRGRGTAPIARPGQRNLTAFTPYKGLIGIPWRVAFALQDDGWILRNAIVWHKPNAMPESVRDRLANRYETVFLFSKSPRYWFDLDPIREAHKRIATGPKAQEWVRSTPWNHNRLGEVGSHEAGRNPGDVWTIPTRPFKHAHYATYPPELPRMCILPGCPPKRCQTCGVAPTRTHGARELDPSRPQARRALELAAEHGLTTQHIDAIRAAGITDTGKAQVTQSGTGNNADPILRLAAEAKTALGGYYREFLLGRAAADGWTDCGHGDYRPGVVLDPFSGSGTTGAVAVAHGHHYIGVDLDAESLALSLRTRLSDGTLDFQETAE